jgi:hypothetical protein
MTAVKRALAVVGLVVALAACSSDDGGGSAEGDSSATTTSAAPTTTTTTVPAPTSDDLAAAVCASQRIRPAGRVQDPQITELSGIVSLESGWWVHNDSGDTARVFDLADDGRTLATVNVEGVEATDWEDITGLGNELFVGDIGDNEAVRPEILIQHLTLPEPPPTGEVTLPAADVQTITLHYPNGPRDAETLMIDPRNRELIVLHKVFGGDSEIYVAPEDDWADGDATLVASGTVDLGDSPLDALTSGDIGYGGRVVALRTYAGIIVHPIQEEQSVADALAQNPPCDAPSAIEVQGEAIAFTSEGYVTIGEGEQARINRFAVTVPEVG